VLLSPAEALRDYVAVAVGPEEAQAVGHGKVLPVDDRFAGPGPWAVVDGEGRLLAVYGPHRDGTAKPEVVVAPAGAGPASSAPADGR
jgi:hypothetical protein